MRTLTVTILVKEENVQDLIHDLNVILEDGEAVEVVETSKAA